MSVEYEVALRVYPTGEEIRPATDEELAASAANSHNDDGAGVIFVDDRACFVENPFQVVRSDRGNGGWSLHEADEVPDPISGLVGVLASVPDFPPKKDDYLTAIRALRESIAGIRYIVVGYHDDGEPKLYTYVPHLDPWRRV